jgi:phosphoribosylanthranilate isomerase
MTWVKLCGMTRRADVEAAAELGADAVGFNVAAESPRRVSPEQAAELGRDLAVERFLVSVDLEPQDLVAAARRAEVTGVQPHGRHASAAAEAAFSVGLRVLYPVRVADQLDLSRVPGWAVPILDTAVPGRHGGTGRSFDWTLAAGCGRDVVIAGGLTPENLSDAMAAAEPWGVDTASGIEVSPGVKDPAKMRRFLEATRW